MNSILPDRLLKEQLEALFPNNHVLVFPPGGSIQTTWTEEDEFGVLIKPKGGGIPLQLAGKNPDEILRKAMTSNNSRSC